MKAIISKIERFLRLERFVRMSDIIRARSVYVIGSLFILSQIFNFALMYQTYGRYTLDHVICVGAIAGVLGSIAALRFIDKFYIFAGFYSLLLISGVLFSSIFDFTGVNSALLPLLFVGVMLNGFISGWRMVLGFGAGGLALIGYLYLVSAGAPTGALFDPNLFASRNTQRAIQAVTALIMMSAVCSLFAYHMHKILFELEEKIEQVEAAEQEKNRFLANMSHELRTPMNGVIGFVNLLGKTELGPQQKQYLGIINKSTNAIMSIVNDALDIAKLDGDEFFLTAKPFNLETAMKSIIHLHTPTAQNKALKLGLRYDKELPRQFIGDEKRIRQIINRIVTNGLKFTDHGSVYLEVNVITVSETTARVEVSVADTGVGLSQQQQVDIFDRFRKVWNQKSQQSEGTGLGLSVAHEIAKRMNGAIEVESEIGSGSTFCLKLELPLAYDVKEAVSETLASQTLEILPQVEATKVA